jgi:hypothetical protein
MYGKQCLHTLKVCTCTFSNFFFATFRSPNPLAPARPPRPHAFFVYPELTSPGVYRLLSTPTNSNKPAFHYNNDDTPSLLPLVPVPPCPSHILPASSFLSFRSRVRSATIHPDWRHPIHPPHPTNLQLAQHRRLHLTRATRDVCSIET